MALFKVTVQTIEEVEIEAESAKEAEEIEQMGEMAGGPYEWVSSKVLKVEEMK